MARPRLTWRQPGTCLCCRNKRVAATYVLVLTPVRELAVQARPAAGSLGAGCRVLPRTALYCFVLLHIAFNSMLTKSPPG